MLSNMVEASGIGKNSFIKDLQIDRSSFFKFLSGQRLPGEEQLGDILPLLHISAADRRDLLQEYTRARDGERIYQCRKEVEKCFQILAEAGRAEITDCCTKLHCHDSHYSETEIISGAVRGREAIDELTYVLLEREFRSEAPEVDLFIPDTEESIYRDIRYLRRKYSSDNIRIRHLLRFPPGEVAHNSRIIQAFNNALRLMLSPVEGYKAWYYYDAAKSADRTGALYPYYLFTKEAVLLYDYSVTECICIRDAAIINAMRSAYERAIERSTPLTVEFKRFGRMYEYLDTAYNACPSIDCSKQFSAESVVSERYIERYMPEQFRESAISHLKAVKAAAKDTKRVEYISMDGLRLFAEEGEFVEFPKGLFDTLEIKDRAECLRAVLKGLGKRFKIVDTRTVPIISDWHINLIEDKALILRQYGSMRCCIIEEMNIVSAFTDALNSLGFTQCFVPEEEAARSLKELIDELEEKR